MMIVRKLRRSVGSSVGFGILILSLTMPGLTFGQADGAAAEDSDADGLPDVWETKYFGNLESGSDADGDGDGLDNAFEAEVGTDPTKADTDGDGHPDWVGVPGVHVSRTMGSKPGLGRDLHALAPRRPARVRDRRWLAHPDPGVFR